MLKRIALMLLALLLALPACAEDGLPELPGIPRADEARLNEAANAPGGTLRFINPEDPLIWPMIPAEEDGFACLTSTNWGVDGSVAVVNVAVEAKAGDALNFTFKTSLEAGFDVLQLCVNGEVVKTFTGNTGWRQYACAFPADGLYEVSFRCVKDNVSGAGADAAWIRDVQLLTSEAAVAALAENPVYPEGTGRALTVTTPGAREITFDDPSFALTMVHGIARYFIVPGGSVQLTAALDATDDPDGAVAVIDDDTEAAIVLSEVAAADGYAFEAAMLEDFSIISLYPYSGCSAFELRTVVCFPDEAAVDGYVRLLQDNAYLVHGWSALGQTNCRLTAIDQHGEFLEGVMVSVLTADGVELLTSDAEGAIVFAAADGMACAVHIVDAPEGYTFDPDRSWMLDAENPEAIIDVTRIEE